MSETTGSAPGLVLLDRDGTLNVERHYLSSPEQVELLPGSAEAVGLLRDRLGVRIAVITNQSGVARGYFDEATLDRIHERLRALLAEAGQDVDAIYACLHHPDDGCGCRKPAVELARRAAEDFDTDLSRAFVVGDNVCDIELGEQVGATTVLVRSGHGARVLAEGRVRPDYVADDLLDAVRLIEIALDARTAACR